MDTGEAIKSLRKREGMTQQQLAELLGVKKSSVQKYECGRVQNLKMETLQKLCKIFQVAPFAFVFPDAWRGSRLEYGGSPDFYKYTAKYSLLTDEGKQKVLDYVEDIGQVALYIRKDAEDYEALHKLFLQMGGYEDGR